MQLSRARHDVLTALLNDTLWEESKANYVDCDATQVYNGETCNILLLLANLQAVWLWRFRQEWEYESVYVCMCLYVCVCELDN